MRFKVTVAYDGTEFSGFQCQPNERTVQGEIEKALQKMAKGQEIKIYASGRTDAGVHARGQVFHFDWALGEIHSMGVLKALNVLTPEDIVIRQVQLVSDYFNARYDAKSKTYTYRLLNQSLPDPFLRKYIYHHPYSLDKEKIQQCLKLLEGMHDFTSFCSTKTDKIDKVRTIYSADVKVNKELSIWTFTFKGNGFLYHMIRIIMGTLLEVGDGRKSVADFQKILEARDRTKAAKTIAPHGLCLQEVNY